MGKSEGINLKTLFLSGEFLWNKKLAVSLWFGLSLIALLVDYKNHTFNNYIIFKHVYLHTREQRNLYLFYPLEYNDVNLYGPVFSWIIAPFSIFPDRFAMILWGLFNAGVLYLAIRRLPVLPKWQNAILILCSNEMMNTASWLQSNALIAACIIFGFYFINRGKEVWALLFIMLAAFIKLYGIVGFAFFFFSKNRWKFIGWTIFWSVFFFLIPMVFSSGKFIVHSYSDWFNALKSKAVKNVNPNDDNDYQDICVMGMIRRIFHLPFLKNYYVTIPAIVLFGLQYLQFKYFSDIRFRLYLLCSVLITTVIFTTSAESPTYIIAFPAVCLWYVLQEHTRKVNAFFIFALLLTSFSYSDIFTPWVRDHLVRPYSIKALPGFMLWMILWIQITTKQFLKIPAERITPIA